LPPSKEVVEVLKSLSLLLINKFFESDDVKVEDK